MKVRDKKRIKPFMNELAEIWETQCPDWRFGQLLSNVLNSLQRDPFFYEEEEMLKEFKKYFNIRNE
jgi:hypothetical protein